ncbi:MAG: metalloregulator ArsR/SmtB family transcription factor [Alphaproteobacteria bacterium]|nr:metalloregulator ArsR/SmtB family transcription factor [Alphaproteobacteria bacterium]
MKRLWAIVLVCLSPTFALAQQQVDLELVLAIDSSTSVDASEFELQRRGLAAAFLHPDVLAAIRLIGDRGIAVQVVQWAGVGQQASSVDWTLVRGPNSAARFSAQILATPRLMQGFTDIAGALEFSIAGFEHNGFSAPRLVIDVSGDGTASAGPPGPWRDLAIRRGININGLVILTDEVDLGSLADDIIVEHFEREVIGGPGAFVMVIDSFDDFAAAIRLKLVREILGLVMSQNSAAPQPIDKPSLSYNLPVMEQLGYIQSPANLDAIFAALADPTRRAILSRLADGKASVNEIAQPFAISQPAVSRHLKVLERAGLIERGIDEQRRPARLKADKMAAAVAWLKEFEAFWGTSFQQLDTVLLTMTSTEGEKDE